jgi:parvulin-like peptidyl-prolyl isomerase
LRRETALKEQDRKVQKRNLKVLSTVCISLLVAFIAACSGGGPSVTGGVDPNETAATVNGTAIKMEDVERAVKQQARGEESKLSPLELAGARLQVLQSLIEQEVMYQKAQKESTVPTDEEVNAEVNKQKVDSHLSAEEFDKQMKDAGLDEKSLRENVKKGLAIKKLVDKITGKIETPKDSEIDAFYKGNPEMFVKKRGVRLAAIVIDPANTGEGDTTTNEQEASLKVKEVLGKLQQPGSDFAALAREYSEDPSKFQGGDLGYFSEEDLKQNYPQLAAGFMNPDFTVGRITNMVPINGKGYIFKLQERNEKDEALTLESPNVKPQITDLLVNNRKQLLAASYQAIAMNEAKIENYLAKKVIENPNELSGARPAPANTPAANTSSAPANSNAVSANVTSTAASNSSPAATNPASNSTGRPGANAVVNRPGAVPARPANTGGAPNTAGNRK